MVDNSNELGKELALIIRYDKETDYSNIQSVQSLYDSIKDNNTFNTILGKRYTDKLNHIIQTNSNDKCVFCNNIILDPVRTVFCPDCVEKVIAKSSHPSSQTATESKPDISISSTIQTIKKNKKRSIITAICILAALLAIVGLIRLITPDSKNALRYIGINKKVNGVILNSESNTSLDIAGVHVGDTAADVMQTMNSIDATYDVDNSISGITEIYYIRYRRHTFRIEFSISSRKVTRIMAEIN